MTRITRDDYGCLATTGMTMDDWDDQRWQGMTKDDRGLLSMTGMTRDD